MVPNLPAAEALTRLLEGNVRFASNVVSIDSLARHLKRGLLALGQQPFATVLGCSDSRAPAELLFDQGLGELFVIRVAGNVVSPSQVGSVEFAAERYGTRLVIVMGHTHCGAIEATYDSMSDSGQHSTNVMSIVQRIRPSVETVRETLRGAGHGEGDRAAVLRAAGRANVRVSVEHLRHGSAVLEKLILEQGLVVVGAEYDVESGKVEVFDPPPAAHL
jgi:carbonic anhydrase